MKKLSIFFLILCTFILYPEVKNPGNPKDPERNDLTTVDKNKYNITIKKQNGFFYKGYIEGMSGFYLDSLTWEDNQYGNKQKLIDFVKSINIKGYKVSKKTFDNLSLVYYTPHIFDIELKTGELIKDVKGTIKQIDSFEIYDETGKEKCYTFFVRYWLEDKGIFSDNNSSDFDETPPLPKQVVTFIEFLK